MKDKAKAIAIFLTVLSAGATLLSTLFDKRHQENLIDEAVKKYLAEMKKEG